MIYNPKRIDHFESLAEMHARDCNNHQAGCDMYEVVADLRLINSEMQRLQVNNWARCIAVVALLENYVFGILHPEPTDES